MINPSRVCDRERGRCPKIFIMGMGVKGSDKKGADPMASDLSLFQSSPSKGSCRPRDRYMRSGKVKGWEKGKVVCWFGHGKREFVKWGWLTRPRWPSAMVL